MRKRKYDVKDSLGHWPSRSSRLIDHFFDQELKKLKMTRASYSVLNCISNQKNSNPGDIVAYLEYDKAFVSRILDKLEKDNLIKRTLDENDRRHFTVSMTTKGQNPLHNFKKNWEFKPQLKIVMELVKAL